MRTPTVGGNWKMNTNQESAAALVRAVVDQVAPVQGCEVAVYPPFPYLLAVGSILHGRSSGVRLGAQDVSPKPDGALTGEVSMAMLQDCGASSVLAGHSERRHVMGEPDALVNEKVLAVLEGGLEAVLCVGETIEQRQAGQTNEINERQVRAGLSGVDAQQMARVVVAYEPVWAIGTGKTATPEDAQAAHAHIRSVLSDLFGADLAEQTRITYGGSVKPANAAELCAQPDIDGGLIGGASLKPDDFAAIVKAAASSGHG